MIEPRSQTKAEELANSLSHGCAFLMALIFTPILIVAAVQQGGASNIVGMVVFSCTMLLLYLTSTLYHGFAVGKAKQIFATIDHCVIYVFIAGSYTPFALGVLHGAWGWILFGLIWGIALLGTILKVSGRLRNSMLSTSIYLGMGWLVLIAAVPLIEKVSIYGILWLVAGGLAYTVGTVFYLNDNRLHFGHFIWHLFVIAGSTCHSIAVYWYSMY